MEIPLIKVNELRFLYFFCCKGTDQQINIHREAPLTGAMEHKFCARTCAELGNSHLFIGEAAA